MIHYTPPTDSDIMSAYYRRVSCASFRPWKPRLGDVAQAPLLVGGRWYRVDLRNSGTWRSVVSFHGIAFGAFA